MKLNKKALDKWFDYKPRIIGNKYVEFYNSSLIWEHEEDIDIAMIYSGRNRGKSFDVSAKAIVRALLTDGKEQFGYMRRFKDELSTESVEGYFSDKLEFLTDVTDGQLDSIICFNKSIYVGKVQEDGTVKKEFKIGKCFAINTARSYKSIQFPDITVLIGEEIFTDDVYCPDEPNKVLNLISTIERNRKIRTYLISNTISKINPYASDWCLTGLNTQKTGTIDIYKLNTGEVDVDGKPIYKKIACEYLKDALSENDTNKKEQRFNRLLNKRILTSTLSNKWDEKTLYPVMRNKFITQFDLVDRVVFTNKGFSFLCSIFTVPVNVQQCYEKYLYEEKYKLSQDTMLVAFVERKSSSIIDGTRVFTDEAVVSPYYTRGLIAFTEADMNIFKLIESGRTFYANNLTANEFSQCYRELKTVRGV